MITSPRNRRVARAVRLKKRAMRERDRRFLVEGARGVGEALRVPGVVQELFFVPGAGGRVAPVVEEAGRLQVPAHPVSDQVMAHLTSAVTPPGVVAVASFVDVGLESLPVDRGCVAVLVEVRDPGNAGAVLRSADATAAGGVVVTSSSVDVYNPKAVRAAAGSLFHVPVARAVDVVEAVASLRSRGAAILAADAGGPTPIQEVDLTRPTAVLLGGEGDGLPPGVLDLAEARVRVPIPGRPGSLGLAGAATLVLFEAARQRGAVRAPSGPPAGGKGPGARGGGEVPVGAGEEDPVARMVAGAAHDLRSPITALRGFAHTLLGRGDRLEEGQRRSLLEWIAADAERLEILLGQLVDGVRLRSGGLRLAPEPTDLLEAARAVGELVARWGAIEVEVGGERALARADPGRLRCILAAVVEGAAWWADRGAVRVRVGEGGRPVVVVSREGPTIEGSRAAAVFDLRAPGAGGGSKLGLSVARELAEAHGGSLEVSVEGSLAFVLTLPAASDPPVN